jgi:MFS family permease
MATNPTSLRASLAGLRPIRGLLASVAVARCSVMLYPFYAAYLAVTRQHLSSGAIGLVIGAFGIGALVADVSSGALTTRIPERALAVAGLVGVAVVVLGISVTDQRWTLTAETAAWGFCYELVNPIAYTLVARAMPESSRRFAFAAVRLAINVGMGIGPVLAGLLFKVGPGLLVWGTAIGYVVAAVVLARARTVTVDGGTATVERADEPDANEHTPHERRFWGFFAATLPIHIAYALPPTVVSVYVIHELHHAAALVSAIFAINAVMVITCEIALNHAMSGWRRRTTLVTGYLCGIAGFALMGLGAISGWFLLVATAVWTLGEMIIFPALLDHISAITPHRLKARNMGFYSAGVNLGVLVAPLLFLPVSAVLDATGSWALVAGILAAGLAGITVLSSRHRLWGDDAARPATRPAAPEPVPAER